MTLEELIIKVGVDAAGVKAGLGEATQAANSTGAKLKGSLMKIGGALGVAFGAAEIVKGIYQIGKAAVESYAEYEQLVGGVETLFGAGGKSLGEYAESVGKTVGEVYDEYHALLDAQDTVMKNAANAYKTAGMSANEYMETVTSFSASLLQSLGGDTQKAAEVADMALIDMADNANKMGSSMESIQNAYQGFAKQNYTMLDNLKLGYGGTKTEMERLLADAEALTGVHYDISNLSDVYAAIHAIQTEIGITGTTAKEASDTISGSIASMKAAWQNLLTGLGDPDADIEQLSENLTETIIQVAKNLLPVIGRVALGLLKALWSAIDSGLASLGEMFWAKMDENVAKAGAWFSSKIEAVRGFFESLKAVIIGVFAALGASIIASFTNTVSSVKSVWSGITSFFTGIWDGIKNVFNNAKEFFLSVGRNIIEGIKNGIEERLGALLQSARNVVDKVKDAFTNAKAFFVRSPSRWGFEVGRYVGLGVALGIEDSATDAQQKAQTFAAKVMSATSKAFTRQIKYQNMSIAEQIEGWTEIQKMFVAGSDEYLDAEEKIFDLKQKQRDDDLKAYKEYANNYLGTMDKIVKGISDARKKYADALASRTEAIAGSYGLFDEAKPVGQTSGTQLTRNLAGQVRNIERFYTELDNLAQRGVAEGLIEEIRGQGPDALDELLGLLSLSDKQLAEYNDLYERKQTFAAEQAKRELSGLYDETNIIVQDGLRAAWQLVNDGAPDIGLGFAEQLSEGILSGSDEMADAAIETVTNALEAAREALANGNIGAVTFAQSGLGTASAGIINNVTGAAQAGMPITVNLVLPDGTKFAEWLFDPLVNYARANGTPILAT